MSYQDIIDTEAINQLNRVASEMGIISDSSKHLSRIQRD